MNSKMLFIAIGFLLIATSGHAQYYSGVARQDQFRVGDLYFSANYQGLKSYMQVLKTENPDLHTTMRPVFDNIKRKRDAGLISFVMGGIIGGIMIFSGFPEEETGRFGQPVLDNDPNAGLLFGGVGMLLLGGTIGAVVMPRENDYYDFINLHNRNTEQDKMEWKMGFELIGSQHPGLRFQFTF
ncbi:MAG: hypothetical protein MRY78_14295 [Saprospiraceae bacterium]|nr:hypothetical protein [Saprospiraceae bacterium]